MAKQGIKRTNPDGNNLGDKLQLFFFVLLELIPWFSLVCGIHRYACIMHRESNQKLKLLIV